MIDQYTSTPPISNAEILEMLDSPDLDKVTERNLLRVIYTPRQVCLIYRYMELFPQYTLLDAIQNLNFVY